jgi:hypothetical protein
MDNNDKVLDTATKALFIIGVRYRQADFNGKRRLRQKRDEAFSAYSLARLKLLEDEVICTDDDVRKMEEIRQQIKDAAEIENLLTVIARLIGFFVVL